MRNSGELLDVAKWSADLKSAIQQVGNLRYELAARWGQRALPRKWAGEGGLDGLREIFAHIADDVAAIGFGELQGAGCGAHEAGHGPIGVMHEALAGWQ